MTQLEPTFHSTPSNPDSMAHTSSAQRMVVFDDALRKAPAANDSVVERNSQNSEDVRQSSGSNQITVEPHTCLRASNLHEHESGDFLFPGSSAYHLEFLKRVGSILYASAQRGQMTIAVAAIKVADGMLTAEFDFAKLIDCCQSNLRDTDVVAQSADNELVVIVTNVSKHNIACVFDRLSDKVCVELGIAQGDSPLEVGTTIDLGITFESMIYRARANLLKQTE